MADQAPNNPQVQIPGLGDTNEPWALESTLNKVLQVLQKDFNQGNRQTRGIDALNRNVDRLIRTIDKNSGPDDIQVKELTAAQKNQKALQDLQRSARRQAAASEELARDRKNSKNQARDNLLGGGGSGGGNMVTNFLKSAYDKTKNMMMGSAQGIMNSGGDITRAMGDVARSMPGVMGTVMAGAVAIVDDSRKNLAELSKTGQTFSGSMVNMANAAANAGMSVSQMVNVLSTNSEAVAKLGGANQFLKLQKQVRQTAFQFNSFGLGLEEQNKIIASFTELQMARGRRDLAANAKAQTDYMAQMSGLAKLTGKSIDDLMKLQKDLNNDVDVNSAIQSIFERFGPKVAENAENVFNKTMSVLPEQAQGPIKDMMASFGKYGSIAQSDMGQALLQGGRTDIISSLENALKNNDTAGFLKAMRDANDASKNRDSAFASKLGDLGRAGYINQDVFSALRGAGQVSDEVLANINKNQADTAKKDNAVKTGPDGKPIAGQAGAVDATNMALQEQLGKVYAQLIEKSTELYPAIGKMTMAAAQVVGKLIGSKALDTAIQKTTDALSDMADHIPQLLDSLDGVEKVDDWFSGLIGKIADFGGAISSFIGLGPGIGQLAALLGTAGLAKMGLSAGGNMIKGALGFGGRAAAAEAATAGVGVGGAALLTAAGLGAAGLGVGYLGNKGADALKERGYEKTGKAVSVGSDAAAGALMGAAVGSVVPVLGTAIGAGIGGLLGGAYGLYQNYGKSQPAPQPAKPAPQPVKPVPAAQTKAGQVVISKAERAHMVQLYKYKMEMEKQYTDYLKNMATSRHNYELMLLNKKYQARNAAQAKRTANMSPDVAFKNQIDQAKKIRRSMDSYQDKAAKMGALSQAGVIVQPMIGDDVESQQLQEMKLTNQFLYNIFDIQRGTRKFKPLVSIYQPGL